MLTAVFSNLIVYISDIWSRFWLPVLSWYCFFFKFSIVFLFFCFNIYHLIGSNFLGINCRPITYFNIVTTYLKCVNFALLWKIIVTVFFPLLHAFLSCFCTSLDGYLTSALTINFFWKTNFPKFKWQYLAVQEAKIFSKCISSKLDLSFTFSGHSFCSGIKRWRLPSKFRSKFM